MSKITARQNNGVLLVLIAGLARTGYVLPPHWGEQSSTAPSPQEILQGMILITLAAALRMTLPITIKPERPPS